jgi:hypothetical protein
MSIVGIPGLFGTPCFIDGNNTMWQATAIRWAVIGREAESIEDRRSTMDPPVISEPSGRP